ncbi:heme o synthase [Radiobacillus deserti]|uniref:Protoheme IX farnesyltransferase n=1 Tax=Radiobacillus deserti TaxID=2594883 RepID=A0A516KF66_9BACI|nr:heme o synthase [Radiobacillus deserti]QDP40055.1 protoheme IX farnesyltransferase [Radiobacillus deserti]
MDKVEVSSTQVISQSDNQKESTLWSDFMALIKVGIINSNLMTAFAGFWVALFYNNASFADHWVTLLLTMVGTGFVIAGGCVINNYYDRDIDHIMKRTKSRPTVTGTIPLKVILSVGIGFSVLGVLLLSFTTVQAALFGAFGWFAYVVLYTMWSKRKYTINTAIGSLSGAVPPLIGWAAVDPNLHVAAIIIFVIMFIWQTPHFLALAMKKCKEYKAAGVPMLPVVHGFAITKRQILVYVACLLPLPYLLFSLGTVFLVIATVLNVGWLALGISGFKTGNDLKWANRMFVYSLSYLTIFFLTMIIVTVPSTLF